MDVNPNLYRGVPVEIQQEIINYLDPFTALNIATETLDDKTISKYEDRAWNLARKEAGKVLNFMFTVKFNTPNHSINIYAYMEAYQKSQRHNLEVNTLIQHQEAKTHKYLHEAGITSEDLANMGYHSIYSTIMKNITINEKAELILETNIDENIPVPDDNATEHKLELVDALDYLQVKIYYNEPLLLISSRDIYEPMPAYLSKWMDLL